MDKKYPLKNRIRLEALLHSYGKPVYVFAGHYHNSFEIRSKNIIQYVTPSAMVQLSKSRWKIKLGSKSFGYRLIEWDEHGLTTETVLFAG